MSKGALSISNFDYEYLINLRLNKNEFLVIYKDPKYFIVGIERYEDTSIVTNRCLHNHYKYISYEDKDENS